MSQMRISDEDVEWCYRRTESGREGICPEDAHDLASDLRDLRKLAKEAISVWDDPNCSRDGSILHHAIDLLKAHLEEKP